MFTDVKRRLKGLENRRSNVPVCMVKFTDGSQRKVKTSEAVKLALAIPGTAKSFEELPPYKDNGLFIKALNALLDL